MTRKPALLAAVALSAVLLGTSAAFALSSGLFGADRADRVGTFQMIEQRLAPSTSTTTSTSEEPSSTASLSTSPDSEAPATDTPATQTETTEGTSSATTATSTISGPETTGAHVTTPASVGAATTPTSVRHRHAPDDDGRESDD